MVVMAEEARASRGFSAGLKKLTRHSGVYALGAGLNKAIGFLLIPLVTLYIGTLANFGVKEIAEVTLAVAAQVLGINLLHGLTRFYADYEEESERDTLISTSMLLLAATTGSAMAFGFIFAPELAGWLFGSSDYADVMRAVAAILFFQSLAQVGLRYLQIREKSGAYVGIQLSKLVLEVGLKVLFMVALSMTYMGVILPVVIGEALLGGSVLLYILWRFRGAFSFAMARRLVRYSYPLILSGLAMFVLHQADRYFLIRYHGLDSVGLYGLSYKLGYMVNALVFDSFALIWFPFVFAIGNDERVVFMIRKVASYFTFGVCLVSLFVALFSYEIVAVMAAENFREAHVAVPIVVLAYVFWGIYQVLSTALYYRERTWIVSILVVLAAALNVILNLLFVPEHGYIATAWTTVVAFALLFVATWICSERVLSVRFEFARITIPVALALALYSLGYFVIPDGSLLWNLGCKVALVIAFPLLLLVGGYFTREERTRGMGFLKRHTGRILSLNHPMRSDSNTS